MAPFSDAFLEGLSEEDIAGLNSISAPQLFSVVSWGCAATQWLHKVLNAHPEIFCLHALNITLLKTDTLKLGKKMDGLEYFQVIAKLAYAYKAVGNIHGLSCHHVPELRRVLGDKFNAVALEATVTG